LLVSLEDKLQEFLDEARSEVSRLEDDRERLTTARERKIAEIRERAAQEVEKCRREYGDQLDTIALSIKKVGRLEKALDAEPAKAKPTARRQQVVAPPKRTAPETLALVMRGIRELESPFTIRQLLELVPLHSTTLRAALMTMRDDGLVRPAGMRPRPKGQPGRGSQLWAVTPDGAEALDDMQPELSAVA
jgi:hypothetical protein